MDKIKELMIRVGRAMLELGLQSSHSGNMSARVGDEIYITKAGSMKGRLEEGDILTIDLSKEPEHGFFQASSESGTHRKVLEFAGSVFHAHSIPAILVSYFVDHMEPVDFLGRNILASVPVVPVEYAIGSKEMEIQISGLLKDHPGVIAQTHGPFVRGEDIEEAFFNLGVVDYSAEIILNLKGLGVDFLEVPRFNFPDGYEYERSKGTDQTIDVEQIQVLKGISADIFRFKLSPFNTGSLSVKGGKEMIYCPDVSSPESFDFDIFRVRINDDSEHFFKSLHQAVYRYSDAGSAIFTHSPHAVVQGIKMVFDKSDRIIPVDAEGSCLYQAIPVIPPDDCIKTIVEKAAKYKSVVLTGLGTLSIGHTPHHAFHHCSALKNITYLKTQLECLNKLGVVSDISHFVD